MILNRILLRSKLSSGGCKAWPILDDPMTVLRSFASQHLYPKSRTSQSQEPPIQTGRERAKMQVEF